MESTLKSNILTTLALQHEAQLLEKDKEISALQNEIADTENEAQQTLLEIKNIEGSNASMTAIVAQYEQTIDQIHKESARDIKALMESKEKASREFRVAKADLQVILKF